MWVCYVKKEFAESNARGPHVCQRNVNYARWNVILIVVLEHEDDKQEWREGCFTAVNVFSTTIHRWWKVLTIGGGTDDDACVSTHALGGSGGMLPQEKFLKLGALRPYFYIWT